MNEQALSVREAIISRRSIKTLMVSRLIRKILLKYWKMQHGHRIMAIVIRGALLLLPIRNM